jgi:hypothetical protein
MEETRNLAEAQAMPVINCTSCQSALNVPDDYLGMKVMCPSCRTMFVAGAAEPVLVATPAEPSPFNFVGPSSEIVPPRQDRDRSPNDAFAVENRLDDSDLRQRARYFTRPAVNMMRRTATTMVIWCLVWVVAQTFLGGILALAFGAFLALIIAGPIISLIYIGATRLQNYRSYGMAMTGTVLCFLTGGLAVLASLGGVLRAVLLVMDPVGHAQDVIVFVLLPNILLAALVAVFSIVAGAKAMRAFHDEDVSELFNMYSA